jgi:hypothetical protein
MKVDGLDVYHMVAKIDRSDVSLCAFEIGDWAWRQLRVAFPRALGASLLPDHPHVLTPLRDPATGRMRLNRLLGQLARRLGVRYLGGAAEPQRIADRPKLERDLRYIGLNAPRARLVHDPLGWLFSTHRDVVGATVDPWIDARRLARVLRRPIAGFVDWYHRYVSADPTVAVPGTAPPRPAIPSHLPRFPLGRIARAAAAATRSRPEAIRSTGLVRDLFVALARDHGWRDWTALARACARSTRAIRRSAEKLVDVAPARLCLGDNRLLQGVPRWDERADERLKRTG